MKIRAIGTDIGSVYATKQVYGKDTYYLTKSHFYVNLLVRKIDMTGENKTHYRDGKLIEAVNKVVVNGEVRSSSTIKWDGKQYTVKVDGEPLDPLLSPIYFSGSLLYHEEPLGKNKAFSESSGVTMRVSSKGNQEYQVVDPQNGRKMIYAYKKGELARVEIKHPILTVYMSR